MRAQSQGEQTNKSVLQDWVCELPFMQQALLCVALRGPDGVSKFCGAKDILRFMRGAIFKPADPTYNGNSDSFMWMDYRDAPFDKVSTWQKSFNGFFSDVDFYPHHFLMHLFHAAEVIGYQHPDSFIAECWNNFYLKACKSLHMNPETILQMDERIGHLPEFLNIASNQK